MDIEPVSFACNLILSIPQSEHLQVRLAIVTDIHHRPGGSQDVLAELRSFVDRANDLAADVMLDLGDRLRDTTAEGDRKALEELASIFAGFRGERVHLLGNHDVINLDASDHAAILGVEMDTRTIRTTAATLVAWQPDVSFHELDGFNAAAPHLPHLLAALDAATGLVVIATHYPVSGQSMVGNPHFEQNPSWAFPPDSGLVRQAVADRQKCRLWLSGHIHQTTENHIDNIAHICISAISEPINGFPELATAICDIDDEVSFDVSGIRPMRMSFSVNG